MLSSYMVNHQVAVRVNNRTEEKELIEFLRKESNTKVLAPISVEKEEKAFPMYFSVLSCVENNIVIGAATEQGFVKAMGYSNPNQIRPYSDYINFEDAKIKVA